jgi:hypothetical protein
METCINYCTTECAYVSSDERHWVSRIRKLAEQNPEQVRIIRQPEQNDGCIYATVPVKWVRITPPRKLELTDEQRAEIADRLKRNRMDSSV